MTNFGHKFLGFVLSLIKAFWHATVQVAWGIAGFFLLVGLMGFFNSNPESIATLLKIIEVVQKNCGFFFFVIFLFEFITDFKQFLKPVYQEEIKNKAEVKL